MIRLRDRLPEWLRDWLMDRFLSLARLFMDLHDRLETGHSTLELDNAFLARLEEDPEIKRARVDAALGGDALTQAEVSNILQAHRNAAKRRAERSDP